MTQPGPAIGPKPADLIKRIREIVFSARSLAARRIDTAQVVMNFAIGQRIVEHEQARESRAAYGCKVSAGLSNKEELKRNPSVVRIWVQRSRLG